MPVRDLSDQWGWIETLVLSRIDRLESGAFLENSSISSGRMRFIGGLLRVDSGGRVEIVGTLQIDGATTVTGTFTVEGPWSMDGNGVITGNVSISGNVTLTGDFTVAGGGKITAGNVEIEPNRVRVGGGASPATLEDGAMSFGTGGRVEADTTAGGARMLAGDAVVNVGDVASVRKGSSSVIVAPGSITVNAAGGGPIILQGQVTIPLGNIPTILDLSQPEGTLRINSSGTLLRVVH